MNKLLLGILLLGCLSAGTLREAVDLALQNNLQVQESTFALAQAQQDYIAFSSGTLPRLSLDASYKYIDQVASMELPVAPGVVQKVELGAHNNTDSGLSVSWLAFDGFAREANIDNAHNRQQIAFWQLEKTRKQVALQVSKLAIQLSILTKQREQLSNAKDRLVLQRDRLNALVKEGMSLPLDALSLSLAISQYEQNLIVLQSQLESLKDKLKQYIGADIMLDSIFN